MQLNLTVWFSAIDNFTRLRFIEGCALMFPLVDKAAKLRRPKDSNRVRMSKFITDELEHVIALGTGLDIVFDPNSQKIILGNDNIGEIIYKVRCSVLHEAETPESIKFTRNLGVFQFSFLPATSESQATITVPAQFFEVLHVVLLGCPEYTSISSEFVGRKIRFGRHEIMPSQCVGNFAVLRQQLLFGVNLNG